MLAAERETRRIDGRDYVLEYPIHADVALIKAHKGDRWGNLVYRKTARNFGPVMAMAAKLAIAEVSEVVEVGALDPETIVTPGIFVQRIVRIDAAARHAEGIRRSKAMAADLANLKRMSRKEMAARVASDIPDGTYVNLGIGLPTLVADFLPKDKDIFLHTENGLIGMGPAPAKGQEDPDLINAGKQPVTALPGAAYFHHADSFAMMRGGHLDICVFGAFQVSVAGDLANWHTGEADAIPAVGGAMDLAIGAKRTFVMMEHFTKAGDSKIVPSCTYPLTAKACVSRIYTDLAVIDVGRDGLVVREMVPGLSLTELALLSRVALADGRTGTS